MREDDRVRMMHMLDAAEAAMSFVAGKKREDLETDRVLALALVRSIEITGEAGARVSQEGRAEVPDVPWREIVAMRNRLIHAYFDVDLDIVWRTVKDDLPTLVGRWKALCRKKEVANSTCHDHSFRTLPVSSSLVPCGCERVTRGETKRRSLPWRT